MTSYVIPAPAAPSLIVRGSAERFPLRRIFCVGRNYVEHQKEMGGDGREQPFFFAKSAHAAVPVGEGQTGEVHYPQESKDYNWETELVVAISKGGRNISADKALDHVWGYAVGLDMTRRDLQQIGKDKGRPWTFGKDFDQAAPVGALSPASAVASPGSASILLEVNGAKKQDANTSQMIWNVQEQIAYLSRYYTVEAGDIIFTGTPAGVGPAKPGDKLVASIAGLAELRVTILPPL